MAGQVGFEPASSSRNPYISKGHHLNIRGSVMMQEFQQMFGFSAVGILGTGFVITILLMAIGLREKDDLPRRVRVLRAGGVLLGLMMIVTGFTWYAYFVYSYPPYHIESVIILTIISSVGGLISGVASCIPLQTSDSGM